MTLTIKSRFLEKQAGFTLAELLIALFIMGVIATFSIPKVLYNSQNAKKIGVFKEVISAVHQVVTVGWMAGEIHTTNTGTYLNEHLNGYKVCANNSWTEQCWRPAQGTFTFNDETQPGLIMQNGATILTGQSSCCDWINGAGSNGNGNTFIVDWNGTEGPNLMGDDQIKFFYCIGPGDCWGTRPGTIAAADSVANTDLYESLFGH